MSTGTRVVKNDVCSWGKSAVRFTLVFLFVTISTAAASHHYTEKQLDALATRVGKTYWITEVDGRTPSFLSAPTTGSRAFRGELNQSFVIAELSGRKAKKPFFRVKFDSGKEGYIAAETFLEEFNATIVTVDPLADQRQQQAAVADEDKKRIAWIQAQPWSQPIKEAALKRQAAPGLKTGEVEKVMGKPVRVIKLKGPLRFAEEHWFYADGSMLVFQNGLLTRTEQTEKRQP